ncbi:hypothetical protein GGS20DRAFT_577804 [Poronia punctata]|nr:hypothetical protein GGS20DRAFT_577804 [Poronia punctata]
MGVFGMEWSHVLFSILYFFKFVLAITVIALYGIDVDRTRKAADGHVDGKWVYALVVATLSAVTAVLYLIPAILRHRIVPIWSFIIFILWIALFGIFGKMFIDRDPKGNQDVQRMKNAVWVDLANALLWLIGTGAAAAYWWSKSRVTRWTGRANV